MSLRKFIPLLLLVITLTGCQMDSPIENGDSIAVDFNPNIGEILIDSEVKAKTASFITKAYPEEDSIILELLIENPALENIVSVRSWLTYNPEYLDVLVLQTDQSDFDLTLETENQIDKELGLIKIGRARSAQSLVNKNIKIAKLKIKKIKSGTAIMEFYDYGDLESNKSQVNVIDPDSKTTQNILIKPHSSAILIK